MLILLFLTLSFCSRPTEEEFRSYRFLDHLGKSEIIKTPLNLQNHPLKTENICIPLILILFPDWAGTRIPSS